MKALLARIILCLPLTGCLSSEMDITLAEDEVVTADVKMTLGRQLYDMMQMGGPDTAGICPNEAETTIGGETVICSFTETTTLDEAIVEAAKARDEDPFLADLEVVRVDEERVRLILPLEFDKIEARPAELSADNPMFSMITSALANETLTFRLRALQIEDSNGVVSEDGTMVELAIPTVELLEPSGQLPKSFTAVLKYRDCGLLGFSCR